MKISTFLRSALLLSLLPLLFLSTEAPAQESAEWEYEAFHESVTPKDRSLHFYSQRSWPFGKIPGDARLRALGAMEKMPVYSDGLSSAAEDSWRQLGPYVIGGRVRSIAVHPTDGETLWIGAADGGVWKSTDGGASWSAHMQNENALSMGAVAVDPSNPEVLYAGTGELSSNTDAYTGAGVFKSTDGGETWTGSGLTTVGAFSRIIVHPSNGNIVYAGATKNNSGFYKSIDGGKSWNRTLNSAVSDIQINPENPDELWVALMTNGVRYSSDGGENFSNRSSGMGTGGATVTRVSIDVSRSNPSILYALSYETIGNGVFSRIYKSENSGASWTRVYNNDGGLNFLGAQGWYNNCISIKPDNPDHVVAGGVQMVRTINGGGTWNLIASGVHPDHHAFAYSTTDPNVLYNGNDGGMYRSDNGGNSFARINNGLAISQFYAMGIDQREDDLTYGGTQDNGTLTTESTNFGDILGGDGFWVAVDPVDETIIYAESQFGNVARIQNGRATSLVSTAPWPNAEDQVNWSAPLVLDPNDPERLFSGRRKLWVTFNPRAGRTAVQWTEASPEVRGNISALVVSPHDSKVIFLGSSQGLTWRTTNETQDWEDLSFGHGLPNRAVTNFIFSRTDPNTLYVSFSGFFTEHIFKTTDLGENWVPISAGLPDIPVNALELHPDDEQVIFAGTDLGMFITTDGGASWAVYNEGLPRVAIADLEVHLASKTLRAATHGRSMFERGIGGEPIELTPTITSPHGGEVWTGGTPSVLAWGGFTDPEGVRVEFTLDDGANWRELKTFVAGNAFRWNTVNANTQIARIRISGMSQPNQVAISNTFTIEPFSEGTLLNNDSKPTVPYGVAYDGEHLWTTDFGGNTLLKLDPETLDAVEVITLGPEAGDSLFTDLTYYPPRQTLFIHRLNSTTNPSAGGSILEVFRDGTVRGVWASPAGYPIGLAWLGDRNPDSEFNFLIGSDRDGEQRYYFYNPDDFDPNVNGVSSFFLERDVQIESGPRGMAADKGSVWQVITDFSGGTLQGAEANQFDIENISAQDPICSVTLAQAGSTINGRGVELDDRNNSLWLTDFGGNLYKVANCYTEPGPSDSGRSSSVEIAGVVQANLQVIGSRPNPFSGSSQVTFSIGTRDRLKVTLYDRQGRAVQQLADRTFEPGEHQITVEPGTLPSGEYTCEIMTSNGQRKGARLVYLR